MSQENVEIVKRAWATPEDSIDIQASAFQFWDEDLRIENMPEFPIQGVYEGHEGLVKWRADIAEVVDDLHFEVEEVVDVDDERVLSVQRLLGRASHTGIEIDVLWASVMTLREGKIAHAKGYWTPEQAREALGLTAGPPE